MLDARSLPGCQMGVDHGCAAKTWATAPRLKAVVLIRLDRERRVKEPLARAQDDRMHDKAVLVDQAGRDERPREPRPALRQQVSGGALLLEPRDRFGQVAGGDCRLGPVRGRE